MSCRHHQIPHPPEVCLDCACLAPDKCVNHGPHGEHDIAIKQRDKSRYMWFCFDCGVWLADPQEGE